MVRGVLLVGLQGCDFVGPMDTWSLESEGSIVLANRHEQVKTKAFCLERICKVGEMLSLSILKKENKKTCLYLFILRN
jgi:hypothetical protein